MHTHTHTHLPPFFMNLNGVQLGHPDVVSGSGLDAGGGLWVGSGRGLPGHGVHGAQELVSDAAGLS